RPRCGRTRARPGGEPLASPPPPPRPVIASTPPQQQPILAEPVELDYAGTQVPKKADPLVLRAARPIPVIARPTQDIDALDKSYRGKIYWAFILLMIPLAFVT